MGHNLEADAFKGGAGGFNECPFPAQVRRRRRSRGWWWVVKEEEEGRKDHIGDGGN